MEQKFIFATDSGCDLTADVCRAGRYILMMRYEWTARLRRHDAPGGSAQYQNGHGSQYKILAVNVGEYPFWPELLKQHPPIVHLTKGAAFRELTRMPAGTRPVLYDHPEAELYVVDSLGAIDEPLNAGACRCRPARRGQDAHEAVAWLE